MLIDKFSVDLPDANTTAANQASNLLDTSDMALFKQQQLDDAILRPYWKLAEQQKSGYFIEGDLLRHRELLLGEEVNQLVVPSCRINKLLEIVHNLTHSSARRLR